ncbi:MAG: efflux RND transporter periplasmic adaptor subunit [Elusimicrobiota bacterium]
MKNSNLKLLCSAALLAALPLLYGCHGHDHGEAGRDDHAEHDGHDDHGKPDGGEALPSSAVTLWTARTELFMEHKYLVAGRETSFAAHLTEMAGFKPLTSGRFTLTFSGAAGKTYTAAAEKPSSPGIFRPVITVPEPGKYRVKASLAAGALRDTHDLGEIEVYADAAAAAAAAPAEEEAGGISFLKEQQWKFDFMTAPAAARSLARRFPASGTVRAPLGRHAPVAAPVSGTVLSAAAPGALAARGAALAVLRTADGGTAEVFSPVDGVVALAQVSGGERVEKDWKLFEIADLSSVWVEARVYETEAAALPSVTGALVTSQALERPARSERVVSVGAALDRESGTIPLVFEVPNPGGRLRVGSHVALAVEAGAPRRALAVPAGALIDEEGSWAVYVQDGGESFSRRLVETGLRDGDWVEIKSGLKAGERVVTRGAYKVKLAASSSAIPAHGHAH